jgi:hypothetical protein
MYGTGLAGRFIMQGGLFSGCDALIFLPRQPPRSAPGPSVDSAGGPLSRVAAGTAYCRRNRNAGWALDVQPVPGGTFSSSLKIKIDDVENIHGSLRYRNYQVEPYG